MLGRVDNCWTNGADWRNQPWIIWVPCPRLRGHGPTIAAVQHAHADVGMAPSVALLAQLLSTRPNTNAHCTTLPKPSHHEKSHAAGQHVMLDQATVAPA